MFSKNSYIPPYIKPNLKWYERDGLLTYCDRLAYERFKEDRDNYLKNVKLVNFDIISNSIKNTPSENSIQYYKTIKFKHLDQMPEDDKDAAIASVLRSPRKDIFITDELRNKYFKTWNGSKKFVKNKKNLKKKNQKYFETW